MITISRETDYAVRVILHLALLEPGDRAVAQDIARARLIPRALVRRVVTRLAAAGLIITSRGSDGGIVLARPPENISLLDVVEAMEGPLGLNICVLDEAACPLVPTCAAHDEWAGARRVLAEYLGGITFAKLAGTTLSRRKEAPPT
jgi:Rrf2 family protein